MVFLLLFIICRMLFGRFVFLNSLVRKNVVDGVCLDGFRIMVLLFVIVGVIFYRGIIVGKLNGVMLVIMFRG